MKTLLLNNDGEEVAATERIKTNTSTRVSRSHESFTEGSNNGHNSSVGVSTALHMNELLLTAVQRQNHLIKLFNVSYALQRRLFSTFW